MASFGNAIKFSGAIVLQGRPISYQPASGKYGEVYVQGDAVTTVTLGPVGGATATLNLSDIWSATTAMPMTSIKVPFGFILTVNGSSGLCRIYGTEFSNS